MFDLVVNHTREKHLHFKFTVANIIIIKINVCYREFSPLILFVCSNVKVYQIPA